MNIPRRRFLHLAAGAAALPAAFRPADAQAFPARPVHLIVGFGAGGTPDIIARVIGERLSDRLGQQIVVENRPGAGNNVATEDVVRSTPDGYTLLFMAVPSSVISPIIYHNTSFDIVRDIVPIASLTLTPQVMVVNPAFPAKTVPEFIAYAKANPGKINMASTGTGNLSHLSGELFMMMAGIDLVHVPYRGAPPAQTDLMSGRVQFMIDTVPTLIELIRAGKLRALAVTSESRMDVPPDVPCATDFLPGYVTIGITGLGAPRGTPADIVDRLNGEVARILADKSVVAHLADFGATPLIDTPDQFRRFIADETAKWAKVIAFAGINAQ